MTNRLTGFLYLELIIKIKNEGTNKMEKTLVKG